MKLKNYFSRVPAFLLCFLLFACTTVSAEENTDTSVVSEEAVSDTGSVQTDSGTGWPAGPAITATSGIVMDNATGTVLYAQNADTPLPPAATAKLMTALLCLENCDLTEEVTMTSTGAIGAADGGTNIQAQEGEIFTIEQCLYAILLASANDITMQVAEYLGGSVENFVSMMNIRAQQLGCTNTVFTDPTGLSSDGQQTTARDMALIMQAAIAIPEFTEIATTTSYTISATNLSGGERVLTNNLPLLDASSSSFYTGCLGGKAGTTAAAGNTIAAAAVKDDMTLITVVLQNWTETAADEAVTLLDYAFSGFQYYKLDQMDLNLISGGEVVGPAGLTSDSFTHTDSDTEDGNIQRDYYYANVHVGTGFFLKNLEEEDNSALLEASAKNMAAAKEAGENHSWIPYAVIAGAGAIILILLIIAIAKIARS